MAKAEKSLQLPIKNVVFRLIAVMIFLCSVTFLPHYSLMSLV